MLEYESDNKLWFLNWLRANWIIALIVTVPWAVLVAFFALWVGDAVEVRFDGSVEKTGLTAKAYNEAIGGTFNLKLPGSENVSLKFIPEKEGYHLFVAATISESDYKLSLAEARAKWTPGHTAKVGDGELLKTSFGFNEAQKAEKYPEWWSPAVMLASKELTLLKASDSTNDIETAWSYHKENSVLYIWQSQRRR